MTKHSLYHEISINKLFNKVENSVYKAAIAHHAFICRFLSHFWGFMPFSTTFMSNHTDISYFHDLCFSLEPKTLCGKSSNCSPTILYS